MKTIPEFYHVSLNGVVASSAELSHIKSDCPYILFTLSENIDFPLIRQRRALTLLQEGSFDGLYSDYYFGGIGNLRKVLDYSDGGRLRDDFDFGKLFIISSAALGNIPSGLEFAAFYALRLSLWSVCHVYEPLYTCTDDTFSDLFAYQDPRHKGAQKEYEKVCIEHLKEVGAWLDPEVNSVKSFNWTLESLLAECELTSRPLFSVVIPVYNRERTIRDAVLSALNQKTDFPYNVIVVENHSTDTTGAIIDSISDPRLIKVVPGDTTLKIGGCWNEAVNHPKCGLFVVQLDSDDVYSSPDTLAKVAAKFVETGAGLVIGSYALTDFDGKPLLDRLIDHSEWTDSNGRNNALRINGLGAPRAFFTELLRSHPFPDVSYGEDYAVVIRLAAEYRMGRIWENLYNCRRWEGNSDSRLSYEKTTANNAYKDSLRTHEVRRRQVL